MRGVKFYSTTDLSVNYYLNQVKKIYNDLQNDIHYSLFQIVELYNCTKYIDNGLYPYDIDSGILDEKNRTIKSQIARFYNQMDNLAILNELKELPFGYKSDFLELFIMFKLNTRYSHEQVKQWIEDDLIGIYTICQNKKFVELYGDIVKGVLISNPSSAELILDKYAAKNNKEKIYLPHINQIDINRIMENYIESDDVNLNYLSLIVIARSEGEFNITSEIKLKAKKKEEQLSNQYFKKENGLQFEHVVAFQKDLEEPMIADINATEGKFHITYDKNWLENEVDYLVILYNFIWLFGYLDSNGRISLVNLEKEASALENALGMTGKYEYKINHVFGSKEIFSQMKLNLYCELLELKEVELERVLEWFFNTYIKEEFLVDNYFLELPTKNSDYRAKCLVIFSEIENVLNQFDSFVKYSSIDHELIEINSHSVLFSQVPSLLKGKYVYAKQELRNNMHGLFSDQSSLNYINEKYNEKSFFELINKNKLKIEHFNDYQQYQLQQLLELKYIQCDLEGNISWVNPYKIYLMRDLYLNEVIIYHRLTDRLKQEVQQLIYEDLVQTENTLFSKLEQDYFDYYLNNHSFQNGLQLRNKYMHGKRVMLSAAQHKQNYLIGLKLLICITLKINEEFCLFMDFEEEAAVL